MPIEAWYVLVAGLIATVLFGTAILVYGHVQNARAGNWRVEFRALQLENNRHLKKVHDENTRFFRSIGLTTQQIFERVDGGRRYDPEGP